MGPGEAGSTSNIKCHDTENTPIVTVGYGARRERWLDQSLYYYLKVRERKKEKDRIEGFEPVIRTEWKTGMVATISLAWHSM